MIPEENNFYAFIENIDILKIKEAFEKSGWTSRKASWTDFELTNNWSELLLQDDNPNPLISGTIIPNGENIELIESIFIEIKARFKYELYDNEKNVLKSKKDNTNS